MDTQVKNCKILIVEDELPLLKVLTDKFTAEGFTVIQAKDGSEGLAVALKEHPDLILLDIIMPVMDGMTMLKKLREDNWGQNAPVVMLTNLSDSKNVSDAIARGIGDFLVKSDWTLEDLLTKVKSRLGLSKKIVQYK